MYDVNLSPFLHIGGADFSGQLLGLVKSGVIHELRRSVGNISDINQEEEPDYKVIENPFTTYIPEDSLMCSVPEHLSTKKLVTRKEHLNISPKVKDSSREKLPKKRATIKKLGLFASVGKGGANKSPDVIKVQKALNQVGYTPKLIVDGIYGNKTSAAIIAYQRLFLRVPDGVVDPNGTTSKKLASGFKFTRIQSIVTSPTVVSTKAVSKTGLAKQAWPRDTFSEITKYFGAHGSSNCTAYKLKPPYPIKYGSTHVRAISCHLKVGDSLYRIFQAILDHYGQEEIKRLGLDTYGGCYNNRSMRGGSSWSRHSWGIAIDLNPSGNPFLSPWPEKAIMPVEVIEIFEAEGWKSGGRAWGYDAMHFQATL